MGWAQNNLSRDVRDHIARSLFEVQQEDGAWLNGLCPFHDDRNMSFGYNVEDDVFKCFAACVDSGDLVDLWCRVKGYQARSSEGFRAFKREYADERGAARHERREKSERAPRSEPKVGEIPEYVIGAMEDIPASMMRQLEEKRGWKRETLDALGVRALSHFRRKSNLYETFPIRERDRVAIPIRDEKGVLRNIRVYYPLGKPESASAKIMSWGKGHGSAMLFPAASTLREGLVILCEGEADCICARSHGLNAITQTGKPNVWPESHTNALSGREVVLCYDADMPGVEYAAIAAKNLKKAGCSVYTLVWPDFMGRLQSGEWPADHGQDLTDFFVRHGKTIEDFIELVETAKAVEASAPPVSCTQFFETGLNGRLSFKQRLLADWLIEKNDMLYHDASGQLYRYDGTYYELWSVEKLKREAILALGGEAQADRVSGAVSLVMSLVSMPHGRDLNDMDDWACLQNGMLNLRTLDFQPHDPKYMATVKLGATWHDGAPPKPKRWLQFLSETIETPEVIAQLQEFFGNCLTRITDFGKFLLLVGPGSDGKSTVINVLKAIVGGENCSSVALEDLEDQFQRSALYGKLLNVGEEVSTEALQSKVLKAIVTGGEIQASFKYKDSFKFKAYCKLAYATNSRPRVFDNSDGFYRRILPIRFKHQYLESHPQWDPQLENKLMAELDGIFAWSVVGLHRLLKQNRYTACKETDDYILDYRRYNSPVMAFLQDECELSEGQSVDLKDLYGAYKKYCAEGGYKPLSRDNFAEEFSTATKKLEGHTVTYKRPRIDGKRPRIFDGVRLVSVF